MGHLCSTLLGAKGVTFKRRTKKMSIVNHSTATHEGIRTVKATSPCDFSGNSELCVRVVTWNMNGKVSYKDLVELVGSDREFDLLVVGLQETPRRNIAKLLQSILMDTHMSSAWKVHHAIYSVICIRPQNSKQFTTELKVDKHSVGGFGGLIGRKKGAVAIRINYKRILMEFISCHLSAHAHNVEERNSQCRHISHHIFSKDCNPYAAPAHVTVWLGDLNYRMRGIGNNPVRNLIDKDLHNLLTKKDQLLQEAERGQIFNGYCEGTLAFKPTYKYDVGSSNYDTSYKVRVPAWTDRILFKVEDMDRISASLQSYESVDDIYGSDHKPVKAHLCLRTIESS